MRVVGSVGGGGGGWTTEEEGEREEGREGDVRKTGFGGGGGGRGLMLGAAVLSFVFFSPSASFSAVLQNLCSSSIGTREANVPTF